MDAQETQEGDHAEWKNTQAPLPGTAARVPGRRRLLGASAPRWTSQPLALLLAVVVGVALLWVCASVVHWRSRVATERLHQVEQDAARQAALLRAQQLQDEAAERLLQRQAQLDLQAAAKAQGIAEQQRADDEARRAEADAADRKEKAWNKFYHQPAYCETTATMECVNARIRARRSFEQKWNKAEF